MIVISVLAGVVALIYFSVAAYFNCEARQADVDVDKFRERFAIQLAKDRVALRSIWRGRTVCQPPQVTVPQGSGQNLPIDCTFTKVENGT